MIQPLWRTVWKFLKLKIDLPYDPAIPLPGTYPEKTINSKRDVYHNSIYNTQNMEET